MSTTSERESKFTSNMGHALHFTRRLQDNRNQPAFLPLNILNYHIYDMLNSSFYPFSFNTPAMWLPRLVVFCHKCIGRISVSLNCALEKLSEKQGHGHVMGQRQLEVQGQVGQLHQTQHLPCIRAYIPQVCKNHNARNPECEKPMRYTGSTCSTLKFSVSTSGLANIAHLLSLRITIFEEKRRTN